MWFFIKKLSSFRWQLLLGLLLTILLTASSIALMSLSGWFISASAFAGLSIVTATLFNYLIPAGTIRFLAMIRILSRYGERVINHDFTFKILTELRVWFYQCLIPLAPAHLMQKRSGDLLNRAVQDIDILDHLYLRVLSPCLIGLLTTIGVSIFIYCYGHTLGLAVFSLLLIALIIIPAITLLLSKKIGESIIQNVAALRVQTLDTIQGIIPLLFYTSASDRLSTISNAAAALSNSQKRLANLKGVITALMTILSGITIWITLVIGIPLVNHLMLNGAQLAMIVLCIIVAFEQLLTLPIALLSIGKTQRAATRLTQIANEPPSTIFPANSQTKIENKITPTITFKNVSFQYPTRSSQALNNINLDIPAGMKMAITGPSGAGKTTLSHLLMRVWDPVSGEILLNNQPLSSFSESDLRAYIAIVPQRVHIFNTSIRNNLTLMNESITTEKLYDALRLVDLDHIVNALPNGLKTQMGDFGKQFSGGQIRRIGMARALLTEAPIQIWDEPTTGLNRELFESIWEHARDFLAGKTLIIITHDQPFLKKLDQIITFKNGRCESFSDIISP